MPRRRDINCAIHFKGKKLGSACGMPGKRWPAKIVASTEIKKHVTCQRCMKLLGITDNVHQ